MSAVGGCTKAAEPAADVQSKEAPAEPTVEASACDRLGQAYCDGLPVDCEQTKTVITRLQLPEDVCADGLTTLEQLRQGDADQFSMAATILLQELMAKSPVITEEQLAAIRASSGAGATAQGDGGVDFVAALESLECPGVSRLAGDAPPAGFERWCEKEDGTRHGPSVTWNARAEAVRRVEYRDGAPVAVRFIRPESGEVPRRLFLCPQDTRLREEKTQDLELRWCELEGGTKHGPEIRWNGSNVVAAVEWENGDARFGSYYTPPAGAE